MKLEYTALHDEFVAFFEERVEKVIASAGGTPKQFYRQLKARVQQDDGGADATFTQASYLLHCVRSPLLAGWSMTHARGPHATGDAGGS